MRVLLAAHRNEAPGIATVMRSLSESLPLALGREDELVVIGGAPPRRQLAGARVRWRSKPAGLGGRYGRFAYEQGAIPALARSMDLIHMGDSRPLLLSEQPFVMTVHDLFFLDVPVWLPASVRRFKTAMLKAAIAKRPAAIVCVSEYTRSRLLAHAPDAADSDLRVIHPAISRPIEPVAWSPGEPYFLTLSEINPRKNLLTLLRAFQLARRRGLDLRWKLAGPAGFRSKRLVAALASVEGVEVLGYVSDRCARRSTMAPPSWLSPLTPRDSGCRHSRRWCAGCRRSAREGTAMDETLGDAAFGVDAEDVRGWTEALLRLVARTALRRGWLRPAMDERRSSPWSGWLGPRGGVPHGDPSLSGAHDC